MHAHGAYWTDGRVLTTDVCVMHTPGGQGSDRSAGRTHVYLFGTCHDLVLVLGPAVALFKMTKLNRSMLAVVNHALLFSPPYRLW